MEKALDQGKIRALGISNFDYNDEMFNTIMDSVTVKPAALHCYPNFITGYA